MPRFTDFKILIKILLLLGLLGLVSLGATVFATNKMHYIDNTYGDLIDGPQKAILAISRANRNLVYEDRALYRLTTEATDDGKKTVVKDINDTQGYFDKQIKIASKAMPSQEEDFKQISTKFAAALSGVCAETIRLGSSMNPDDIKNAGAHMREKCDPALLDVMDDITKLTNAIVKINDKASDDASDVTSSTIKNTYIFVLGGLFVILLLSVFLTQSTVTKPIKNIAEVLEELAKGRFDVEIEGSARKDEVGDIAKAALIFRDQGRETARLREEQEQAKIQAERDRKNVMLKMANDFESGVQGIINAVSAAAGELYQTAENMQTTIANVSQRSGNVSSASGQAMSNVQSVAAAVEEMSASVREISGQIGKTSALMNDTVLKTQTADKSAQMLSAAVTEISNILGVIGAIASQINLLALNATIESARAGEAGKGFAVVASEVKNLAGQTGQATETIAVQIKNIKTVSEEVIDALRDIQTAISNVNQYTGGIAAAVEEQSATTGEISANMNNASQGVQSITTSIADVSKGADDADHAAKEVLGAAQMLSKQSEMLNQQVKLFLEEVRA